MIKDKSHNLRRLEAQRNELNTSGRMGVVLANQRSSRAMSDVHASVWQCVCYGRSYSCCRSLAHTWERSSRQVLLAQLQQQRELKPAAASETRMWLKSEAGSSDLSVMHVLWLPVPLGCPLYGCKGAHSGVAVLHWHFLAAAVCQQDFLHGQQCKHTWDFAGRYIHCCSTLVLLPRLCSHARSSSFLEPKFPQTCLQPGSAC